MDAFFLNCLFGDFRKRCCMVFMLKNFDYGWLSQTNCTICYSDNAMTHILQAGNGFGHLSLVR